MTVSAPVRLSPVPPALRLMRKSGIAGVVLEAVDLRLAVGGLAVEVTEGDLAPPRLVAQQMQHAHELAEEQHAMAAVDRLVDQLEGAVELGGRFAPGARLVAFRGSRSRWQQTCRSRSSVVSIAMPVAARARLAGVARRRRAGPAPARRGRLRAARRSVRRAARCSSLGGSSVSTSSFVRRRKNGRTRWRRRAIWRCGVPPARVSGVS